jgi:uncharacterized protein (TIGR00369 family)
LVQPSSARPITITLDINSNRRNITAHPFPETPIMGRKSGIFKPGYGVFERSMPAGLIRGWILVRLKKMPQTKGGASAPLFHSAQCSLECAGKKGTSVMQQQQPAAEFGIADAKRVLGEVFAPWIQDLNLSIEALDFTPSGNAADWQPGAILRMPFSERLCRNGGTVCGQALMAFADTAMVIANLAANRGYRPMTTVDQTTHFMRAVTASDVLAEARVVRLGRTMSFGRVTLSSAADNKPVAMVSSAFAML